MLKWGIIGFGSMGKQFASCFEDNSKDYKLVGISSKSNSKISIKKDLKFYDSYTDLIDSKEIDAVYISTLNNTHKDLVLQCISKNKKILCEKPLGINFKEVEELKEKIDIKSNNFFEGIAYRSHPQTLILFELLKEKEFGKIKKIESNFGFKVKKIKKDSRLFNKRLGGGAVLDLGCYPISFFNLFSQKNDIRILNSNLVMGETNVDISGEIILKINEDIEAKGKISLVNNLDNFCKIFCENGTITLTNPWLPPQKTYIEIESKSRYYKKILINKMSTYKYQLEKVSKTFI